MSAAEANRKLQRGLLAKPQALLKNENKTRHAIYNIYQKEQDHAGLSYKDWPKIKMFLKRKGILGVISWPIVLAREKNMAFPYPLALQRLLLQGLLLPSSCISFTTNTNGDTEMAVLRYLWPPDHSQ